MADIQADVFQFFSHPRATITTQAETRLLFDMRQCHQIRPRPAAGRTAAKRAHSRPSLGTSDQWKMKIGALPLSPRLRFDCRAVDKLKPHGFWLAKNTVAFFKVSLSSLRMHPLTHSSMCCQAMISHVEAGHSLERGPNPLLTPHPCLCVP